MNLGEGPAQTHTWEAIVGVIGAGDLTYALQLTALDAEGTALCSAETSIQVISGGIAQVHVVLPCRDKAPELPAASYSPAGLRLAAESIQRPRLACATLFTPSTTASLRSNGSALRMFLSVSARRRFLDTRVRRRVELQERRSLVTSRVEQLLGGYQRVDETNLQCLLRRKLSRTRSPHALEPQGSSAGEAPRRQPAASEGQSPLRWPRTVYGPGTPKR